MSRFEDGQIKDMRLVYSGQQVQNVSTQGPIVSLSIMYYLNTDGIDTCRQKLCCLFTFFSSCQVQLSRRNGTNSWDFRSVWWDEFSIHDITSSSVRLEVVTMYTNYVFNGIVQVEFYTGESKLTRKLLSYRMSRYISTVCNLLFYEEVRSRQWNRQGFWNSIPRNSQECCIHQYISR